MRVLPIHPDILKYLEKRNLTKKFQKQIQILKIDFRHPSLKFELLEPRHLRFFSFRVDKKYRAIFIFRDAQTIEIIDVNNHYK